MTEPEGGPLAQEGQPASSDTERVILLRGVVWAGQDVNAWKMWQDLMRFWPTPFAPEHTNSDNPLYAHAGSYMIPQNPRLILSQRNQPFLPLHQPCCSVLSPILKT